MYFLLQGKLILHTHTIPNCKQILRNLEFIAKVTGEGCNAYNQFHTNSEYEKWEYQRKRLIFNINPTELNPTGMVYAEFYQEWTAAIYKNY